MSYWFGQMAEIAERKYPEQIAFLRENHGFSQAHANALVMYSRGSKSSRRFNTFDDYLKPLDETKRKTLKTIFTTILKANPDMELVIAWNQPMVKYGKDYVFGVTALTNHLLMASWSKDVLEEFAPRLRDYIINKKTIQIPVDWKVDKKLILDMVAARRAEVES